ncbi:MAG: indolepyruvate ferredoxin oxidoreductase family protein [Rhizobiales bacterium]|nr:indolepyruvate ferredoxin oxidoreductase family protein [Hyphomicrobiales bacterium]
MSGAKTVLEQAPAKLDQIHDTASGRVSLDDKYDLNQKQIFVSGTQAIVRLLLLQKQRDLAAGLNTAGFVTGYRGSPLGGIDQQMHRAAKVLKPQNIVFQPGLNEDLAATAVWGSQQAEMRGEGKYDGVFAMWYAKGPGVDRSGDVFRHANLAGTSKFGGVIALMGDDHTAESSTTAHQSEFHFLDVMMPVLNPAGVQEILDYGLYGWALSRYAGVWVGLKCVKDTIESTASIDASAERVKPVVPTDYQLPDGGLNIRPRDPVLTQEARLQDHKRDAIVAWLRANKLNKIVTSGGPNAKIGVITTGKSYLDVRQAMDDLGIDEARANDLGLRLYKIACPWPIEPEGLKDFARGLDLIIVVEEKRSLIEVQVREELYGSANQPVCIGKRDEAGAWLFPVKGALDPNDVAITIGDRLLKYRDDADLFKRVADLKAAQRMLAETPDAAQRIPYFCSGCPHNSSTVVPDGMRAYAGIGCHYMVQWMDRGTEGFTQMGGEGANWIGEAPFSTRNHVFQNLGDGTYNHSGVMALRWAVDTGTNITYKILFNDAVAMTGGQAHEGNLSVPMIARQVAAEGVKRIAIVTDEPDKYPPGEPWPAGTTIHNRLDLETVQREMAEEPGCTVLIFDQTCAAEKRRRRKRGTFPDPDKRVMINTLVCEGCGDCGVKSNCVSVQPLDTEFGRKRTIDQSSCNKDFSCVNGFCPSFVTVHGARMKKLVSSTAPLRQVDPTGTLPEPQRPELGKLPYGILITGVGGTGVVTIGAILGMAAHIEGKGCGLIDMAGLAQKGGAVYSHVKLAAHPDDIHAIRVAAGHADLVLGCDLVVSGTKKVLAAVRPGKTGVVVNTAEVYPGDFTRNADYHLPTERIKRAIRDHGGADLSFVDASSIATRLLGNSIAANMFMLGFAYQKGFVPLAAASIEQAIWLNGEAVDMNLAAFALGRDYAHAPRAIDALLPAKADALVEAETLESLVARRVAFLSAYQNAAYARRYEAAVRTIEKFEKTKTPGMSGLAEAVARYLFKLMAVKDEYEVARLYTDGSFQKQLAATFDGKLTLEFHLAPPILGRKDAAGHPRKTTFGPWMMTGFRLLAALKGLRGTMFDIFGYSAERRMEQQLIADYLALLDEFGRGLTPANHATALALASLPEKIRGFGHVKDRHVLVAKREQEGLLQRFRDPQNPQALAAE